ncbi:hypothetical protein FRC00_008110, partial [Tulasnella sp. 408]
FDASFNGVDGLTCHEFIQAIRKQAFSEGKSQDSRWMAEIASLQFSGPALEWFEELDDTTQADWGLLKRAILRQYVPSSHQAVIRDADSGAARDDKTHELNFEGKDGKEVEKFVQFIRRKAFQAEKSEDDKWMANLAATHLLGPALRWHSELPPAVQTSWKLLEKIIFRSFSSEINTVDLNAKRISIAQWNTVARASALHFPKSEEEWLERGRRRRADMNLPIPWKVTWHLVEQGEKFPINAISVSPERRDFYHIRAWYQGGLTIGKYFLSHARAWIAWYGKELPYDGLFEVLVGDTTAVHWVRPNAGKLIAVEGGYETAFESALLVARVKEGKLWEPGKAFSADCQGYFPWWGEEHRRPIEEVQVLAWKA